MNSVFRLPFYKLDNYLNRIISGYSDDYTISLRKSLITIFFPITSIVYYAYALAFYVLDNDIAASCVQFVFGTFYFILSFATKKYDYRKLAQIGILLIVSYFFISYYVPLVYLKSNKWAIFVPISAVFMLGYREGLIASLLFVFGMNIVFLIDYSTTQILFKDIPSVMEQAAVLIVLAIFLSMVSYSLEYVQSKLVTISNIDSLTLIYNRRKMDELLKKELAKKETEFSIAILDVDNFKTINDNYGHLVGDEVLKKISKTILSALRRSDFVGRWGGEEFLIIMPNTPLEGAKKCMQLVQKNLQKTSFSPLEQVTCSFGLTSNKQAMSFDSLVSMADKALYLAKANGKDQIVVADEKDILSTPS